MKQQDLIDDLKEMLNDAKDKFQRDDLPRLLNFALRDLSRVAPLVKRAEITLVADQSSYTAPADILRTLDSLWGRSLLRECRPWDDNWPGALPRLYLENGTLFLTPAPSARQLSIIGAAYEYRYSAAYAVTANGTGSNLPDRLSDAVLIRATAQAMQELANRNISKPISLGGSGNGMSMPKNGHPAAIAADLLALFERMAA